MQSDDTSKAQTTQLWRSLPEDRLSPHKGHFHGLNRRDFLRLMGASLAMATTVSCRDLQPPEDIVPYNKTPVEEVPGMARFYATTMPMAGYGVGALAEVHTGRPTRVEGNPLHPSSLGASDAFLQASILELYDPDRARHITSDSKHNVRDFNELKVELENRLNIHLANAGRGLRVLSESHTSPTLAWQMSEFKKRYPQARWHQYEPVTQDHSRKGFRLAFGRDAEAIYFPEKAKVIVSFDEDFIGTSYGRLAYAREFIKTRDVNLAHPEMTRLYCAEPSFSLTGGMADQRWPLTIKETELMVAALAHRLGLIAEVPSLPVHDKEQVKAFDVMVEELKAHRGESLVIAGPTLSPKIHHLVHLINHHLRNVGHTLAYMEPIVTDPVLQVESITELSQDMSSGKVDTLLVLGGNPVFSAPADLNFTEAIQKVPFVLHLSPSWNETSGYANWHVPESHYLESWGDIRAHDGTASLIQPTIRPLHDSRTIWQITDILLGKAPRDSLSIIKDYWLSHNQAIKSESDWHHALHDGIVKGTKAKTLSLEPKPIGSIEFSESNDSEYEISFRPDPRIWDGRFINNSWLQELPKPHTKIAWDNALLIHPRVADELGLKSGTIVEIKKDNLKTKAAIWRMPGQAEKSFTFHMGYGRSQVGRVGKGTGFNAYPIRPTNGMWSLQAPALEPTSERYQLATAQSHDEIEPERDLAVTWTVDEIRTKKDHLLNHLSEHQPEYGYRKQISDSGPTLKDAKYSWGMVIDLNRCIGCGACTIACQSENNIPVVGKRGVLNSREMHWIRVDRYYKGGVDNPQVIYQPVPCMHCEKAPCEVVCPVAATVHNEEGLNEMIYNRCVGTRYCSNNCPYKVRRFNYHNYTQYAEPLLKMYQNPDVTVRARGVMEKCTYCVQRINRARINAKVEDRPIHDGEIITACQSACPTVAITFGDIEDPNTKVSEWRGSKRSYGLLTELGTHPRTTYMTKVTHPVSHQPKKQEGLHDK